MTSAVVLLSGGMDSATVLGMALAENDVVHAVQFQYGSKHNKREQFAAYQLVDWYEVGGFPVDIQTVMLPDVFRSAYLPGISGGGTPSALMDEVDMPHLTYKEIHESEGPSPTVVPFRNANLLSLATTIAVVTGAQYVYAGMHGEDAHNFAYPDCTPEFLGAMANAVYVGTYHQVRLKFPLIWMMKSDVVRMGLKLGIPFELTWSCYEGGAQPCGLCPTCIERIEAFLACGVVDPLTYAVEPDWKDAEEL